MTRQNIHLAMFYFSEEPNGRKNKQVVSRLGRRSNIPGIATYQTFDLQGACQGPIRVRAEEPRAPPLPQPTPGPHASVPLFPEPAGPAEAQNFAPLHEGQAARESQTATVESLWPRSRQRKEGEGHWREDTAEFHHQSLSLFLPSQKLSSSPRKQPYQRLLPPVSFFSLIQMETLSLRGKKKNDLDQKCRCLKYVHCITIFASNYNDGNGWKYIVSICMENNCRVRGQRALCLALECEFLSPVWRPSSLEQIMNTCVWRARAVNLGFVYP